MMKVSEIKTQSDLIKFEAAVMFAIDCANNATPVRAYGCGRAYVDLGKFRANGKAAVIMARHGLKLFSRPYCKYKSVYVGYDNADGRAVSQASAMATAFRECGFDAFDECDAD